MTAAQGALLYAALLWKLYQLVRAPRDVPLRMVTLCLACAAAAFPFGIAAGNVVQPDTGPMPLTYAQYALLALVVYMLVCFFLFAEGTSPRAVSAARRQGAVVVAALVVMTAAALTVPLDLPPEEYPAGNVAVFYLAANAYLGFGLASAFVGARRYARGAQPRLARGLLLASAGMVLMVLGTAVLLVVNGATWAGATVPAALFPAVTFTLLPGILLFIVGVSYPGVATRLAAARVWLQHLRMYHRLAPLWRELNAAFPEDALHRVPGPAWRDALNPFAMNRRYYRRVIECRDGLVRLSPYLPGDEPATDPVELAHRLRAALRSRAEGRAVRPRAVALAVPMSDALEDDVRELAALSRALRTA
ncbi:hypothetical protein SAMN05421810_103165 [Amycolatopsis arida]|uniref:DUF6545 domain-containing protein n=1 Tax=Amycolatopsis arida TaxID=587909 RepID=A0A1I5SK91_9PSEU|nr:MAB_1171c family putative transporter [Amycolatopsis arida]TDX96452.1 hypothetical protein CLV69_103593 [Amycolatopsis arida]SFP71112.1 hypothetical protein SAMN05421810_103165 [Amycolatopsis arida]